MTEQWFYRCPICNLFRRKKGQTMCGPCGKSYDRNAHYDGSIMEAMSWAAARGYRFAARAKRELRRSKPA